MPLEIIGPSMDNHDRALGGRTPVSRLTNIRRTCLRILAGHAHGPI